MPNPCRVLAVDDDESFTDLIEAFLAAEDIEAKSYNDPRQALENEIISEYDVVISDWNMLPGMGGKEFGERVRLDSPSIPILYYTSEDRGDINEVIISLDAEYLSKSEHGRLADKVEEMAEKLDRIPDPVIEFEEEEEEVEVYMVESDEVYPDRYWE